MSLPILKIDGEECTVPVVEGDTYRSAYHGTSRNTADQIEGAGFTPSAEGWYGDGVYFWLNNLRMAVWWAMRGCRDGRSYAVLECVVEAGWTLLADQLWNDAELRRAVDDVYRDAKVPPNWTHPSLRSKLTYVFLMACKAANIHIDSIHFTWQPKRARRLFPEPVQALCLFRPQNASVTRVLATGDVPTHYEEFSR